jgi:hypothetical protein
MGLLDKPDSVAGESGSDGSREAAETGTDNDDIERNRRDHVVCSVSRPQ